MKTAAIICEYNPFHKGHQYQIARTKKLCGADFVVAIMSGNYVQRGDVAIYSKELRAKAAIACGVDLVLELPTVFAMQSAEFFAKKGVEIANATGIIDYLSFGTECDNISPIIQIAELLTNEPENFSKTHMFLSVPDYISWKLTGIAAVDPSDAGINQTVHRLELDVTFRAVLLVAGMSEPIETNGNFLVTETVIVGTVPDRYVDFSGG